MHNKEVEGKTMLGNIIIALLIGAVSGWLASILMGTKGGLIKNIILGVIGGFVGGAIFNLLELSINGYLGTIVTSVVGACVVIFVAKLLSK